MISLLKSISLKIVSGVVAILSIVGIGPASPEKLSEIEPPRAEIREEIVLEGEATEDKDEEQDSQKKPVEEKERIPENIEESPPKEEPKKENETKTEPEEKKPLPEGTEDPQPTPDQITVTPESVASNSPQTDTTTAPTDINTLTRSALVNVICTTGGTGFLNSTTGSGVIIDPKGVVLTNAHIAQHYLLKNYPTENSVSCSIRQGSPAVPAFEAELLYISPSWVRDNASQIVVQTPTGTGEDDFALLLITRRAVGSLPMPSAFPYLNPELDPDGYQIGERVLLAGYSAGFLSSASIQSNLHILSTFDSLDNIFTFRSGTPDLLGISGNIVAQRGSSGGAVVNDDGELLGIVVTASLESSTLERELRAVSMFHINESLKNDFGVTLKQYLEGDLKGKVVQFRELFAPNLTAQLLQFLNRR